MKGFVMKRLSVITATLLVGTFTPTIVIAEDDKAPVGIDTDEASYKLSSSNGDTAVGPLLPQLLLRSGVEGESIKLTLSHDRSEWRDYRDISVSISAIAPFNKKKEIGNFVTDAGLPATASIEVAFSISILKPDADKIDEAQNALVKIALELALACQAKNPKTPEKCENVDMYGLAGDIGGDVGRNYRESANQLAGLTANAPYLAAQGTGAIGRNHSTYADPLSFNELKSKKTEFSVGASLAYMPRLSGPVIFFAGAEYKRQYKLPDEETRCLTLSNCKTAAFGPLVEDKDVSIFGAARLNWQIVKGLPFATELKLAYDFEDKIWGAAMPVYVLQDKDRGLNGGFKITWDENEDFGIGLFIGKTLDFLKL
jgi:hypothetical protein